jgi:hypothetical protein
LSRFYSVAEANCCGRCCWCCLAWLHISVQFIGCRMLFSLINYNHIKEEKNYKNKSVSTLRMQTICLWLFLTEKKWPFIAYSIIVNCDNVSVQSQESQSMRTQRIWFNLNSNNNGLQKCKALWYTMICAYKMFHLDFGSKIIWALYLNVNIWEHFTYFILSWYYVL